MCEHEIKEVITGSRSMIDGEVFDDIDTILVCVICGETFEPVLQDSGDLNDIEIR